MEKIDINVENNCKDISQYSTTASSLHIKELNLIWAFIFFVLLMLSCTIQILRTEPALRSTKYDNATDKILLLFTGSDVDSPTAYVIGVTEDILTVFFTIELALRFGVCADKKTFSKEMLNWIDAICVIPMLIILIVRIIINSQETNLALTYVSAYMSITGLLRVLRLLKLIQHVIGFKILILTLKASMKEILLLMGLISLGTMLFAVSVYFAEIFDKETDFLAISDGLWWAIITMTTVGYGDLKPKTAVGRLVGTLCAMSGILATGLAIPVIASNFDKFYSDAQVLKQARLTEDRPKNAEMRKRAKDPFGPIDTLKRESLSIKHAEAGIAEEAGPDASGITDAIVVTNKALANVSEVKVTSNGVVTMTPKRRFSLGSFNNNAVEPDHHTIHLHGLPIHKSHSSFLSMDTTVPITRDEVTM